MGVHYYLFPGLSVLSSNDLCALKTISYSVGLDCPFNRFTLMSEPRPSRRCLALEKSGFNLITSDAHQVLRGPALNAEKAAVLASYRRREALSLLRLISALMDYNGVISI